MKLTFIWQSSGLAETDWIANVFAPFAGEQVMDGEHRIVRDNALVIDSYLHSQEPAYYAQFRGKNAWLLHLSDETYEGGYDLYSNFRGVFRNYWSGVFDARRVFQLPLGYSNGLVPDADGPIIDQRKYLWSFLGEASKSSRPEMMRAFTPLQPQFCLNTNLPGQKPISRPEYQNILLDSIFVPCPMGNVSLESFRIYESLECGSIPILEKRPGADYFKHLLGDHPIPVFTTWAEAAQAVASLRSDPNAIQALNRQCQDWWADYKQTLRARVCGFIANTASGQADTAVRWPYSIPGWQKAELLRYQTPATIARRVKLQLSRLVREGKLRKTKGV